MSKPIYFDKALAELQVRNVITGKYGVLMPLIKQLTEATITAELERLLDNECKFNRENEMGSKFIPTGSSSFELNAPRDRAVSFERLVKKYQTQLTLEIDRKANSLFSHGMRYRDIQSHTQGLYGVDVFTSVLTAMMDQLLPALKVRLERPLDRVYPIIWIDAVQYKIKEDGHYVS